MKVISWNIRELGAPPKGALIKAVNKIKSGHSDSPRNQVKDDCQEDFKSLLKDSEATFLQKSQMTLPASLLMEQVHFRLKGV